MWQIRGHEPLLKQVEKTFAEGLQAHAYLLVGPAQVGKRTLALSMAQAVNCLALEDAPCGTCSQCSRIATGKHADVRVIGVRNVWKDAPSRREIGIDDVRQLEHQASLKPYEGTNRVFIFDGAELMSEESSNALLKTLEEPPPNVMIILLTSMEDSLLPTIRSRCRRLELMPLPISEVATELVSRHSIPREEADRLAPLSAGCLGWAISEISDPSIMEKRNERLKRISQLLSANLEEKFAYAGELASLYYKNRDEARATLLLWLRWWRDLLLVKEGAEEFIHNVDWGEELRLRASEITTSQVTGLIKAILKTHAALEDNANPRLTLEVLMLSVPRDKPGV